MGRVKRHERLVDFEASGPRVLGRLARAEIVGGLRPALVPPSRARWTFYDNDLRSVARDGFDLGVRRAGGRSEVILVGYEPEGASASRERVWVAPLARSLHGLLRLPEGPLHDRLLPLAAGRPVAPVVVASVSVRGLELRGTRGRTAALAHLELESWTIRSAHGGSGAARMYGVRLRSSVLRAAAVHELAERIGSEFDLRPIRMGRAERARLLLRSEGALPEVAEGDVGPEDTLALAARRVLSGQLRRLRRHDPGTREGSDPEDLHDMRVATRRMRAALRTYGPALPESVRDPLAKDLRWLGRKLGAVRDVDVLLERFAATGVDPHILEHLRRRRGAARDRLLPALRSDRYLRLVSTLDAVCRGWSVEPLPEEAFHAVTVHAAAQARKALDRLVDEGDAAIRRPEAERLHETRIRAKRLRYILEFHRSIGGASCAGLIRRLKAAQDHLGLHQDAVVADAEVRAFLRKHGEVLDAGARAACHDSLVRLDREAAVLRRRWRGRWARLRAALTGATGAEVLAALERKKGDARSGVP